MTTNQNTTHRIMEKITFSIFQNENLNLKKYIFEKQNHIHGQTKLELYGFLTRQLLYVLY